MIDNLFYISEIDVGVGAEVFLNTYESNHCVRVLRLKREDSLYVTNGKGSLFRAVLVQEASKACLLRIEERFDQ